MGRHLVKFRPHSTSESSPQGEMYVLNMVKPSIIAQPLFSIGEFTPERNPLNVTNVVKLLVKLSRCLQTHTNEQTYEHIECGKCFMLCYTLVTIGEFIQE